MSLAKIIADVTTANTHNGLLDRHSAIEAAVPLILADKELTAQVVRSDASRRIKERACGVAANLEKVGTQRSFFDLHPGHALDDEEGRIKSTRTLTRLEFQRAIAVRERQVRADTAYLKRLQAALDATAPIWTAHPDWQWGQVEDAYAMAMAAAE